MGHDAAKYIRARKIDWRRVHKFLASVSVGVGVSFPRFQTKRGVQDARHAPGGPYFAIGTLGVALAAAELVVAWEFVGAGGGISMPVDPGGLAARAVFFYAWCFFEALITFVYLKWLSSTRLRTAINAIRDNKEKAEAMGLHSRRCKTVAWSVAASRYFRCDLR